MSPSKPPNQTRSMRTKERILKAAEALFSRQGFSGTSIQAIAKKAAVNHSLIFHHFSDKRGLWLAVKQRINEKAEKKFPILPSTELPWAEFIKQLMLNSIHFYQSNLSLLKILHWQRIETTQSLKMATGLGVTESGQATRWLDAFKHYQNTQEIDDHIDLTHIINYVCQISTACVLDPNVHLENDAQRLEYIDFCVHCITCYTHLNTEK